MPKFPFCRYFYLAAIFLLTCLQVSCHKRARLTQLARASAERVPEFIEGPTVINEAVRIENSEVFAASATAAPPLAVASLSLRARSHSGRRPVPHSVASVGPEVLKEDCQRLVEGELVFAPSATMRQGTPYVVSARLSRGFDARITSGLDGKAVVIQNTLVSCMVSMSLDSQEPNAFAIENVPSGRKDEQILVATSYTQWDWRVTPLRSGTLHLLLYVTPMLYVDGVGKGLKQFPQPPRVITVSPDYKFAVEKFIFGHWEVWGTLLTAIIVPLFVWLLRRLQNWRSERAANRNVGFTP